MKDSLWKLVLRTSGIVLLTGGLACSSSGLKGTGDAGSDASSGSGGGAGGVLASGGAPGSGGRVGSGGGPGTGGASGYGGVPGTGGKSGTGGAPGSGGKPSTGGVPGSGGTGGKIASDGGGGSDAPASSDASLEVSRPDSSSADRAVDAASGKDANGPDAQAGGADALSAGAQEYVKTYLEPYCTRLAECCAQAGLPTSGMGPCESYELGFVKYLDDGSAVIVPSVVQTLLAQIQSSCDQPSYTLISATTDGTRLAGQPCVAPDQCAGTPALCLFSGDSTNGTCMTPPRGKAGDGCAATCDDTTVCKWGTSGGKSPNAFCYDQDGLRCDSTTNTCVAVAAIGAPCPNFNECGRHAACSNGTCQATAKAGQDCGGSQYCDTNLQCVSSGTSYQCQPLPLAWSGSCTP